MKTESDTQGAPAEPEMQERFARWRFLAEAGNAVELTNAELRGLLREFDAERAARETAERNAALFGDQSDRFEGLYLAERKRVEAAQRREREARALLGQAGLQIGWFQERFGETGAGKAILARIRRPAQDQ